jgi:hypothetical protein
MGEAMRDPQDRWVAMGAAAIPFVVALVALQRLVHLPTAIRLPLALLGVGALLVFGVGLYSLLRRRRQTTTLQVAVLAFGGYSAFLLVDTLVYAAIARVELGQLQPAHRDSVLASLEVWIVILDILKGFTNALATFLFSVNMIGYSRLGSALGWAGILIAFVQLSHKLASFPAHPPFLPGMIAGLLWVLGVAFFMARSLARGAPTVQPSPLK